MCVTFINEVQVSGYNINEGSCSEQRTDHPGWRYFLIEP